MTKGFIEGEPGDDTALPNMPHILRAVWRFADLSWWVPAIVGVLSLLVTASDLLSVALLVPFLNAFIGSPMAAKASDTPLDFLLPLFDGLSPESAIRVLAGLLIAVTIIRVTLTYATTVINYRFQVTIERNLRNVLFRRALEIDLGTLSRSRTGDVILTLNSHPYATAGYIFTLLSLIPAIISFALFAALVLLISWPLTVLGMILFGISAWLTRRVNERMREASRQHNEEVADLYSLVIESLNAIPTIRSFVREGAVFARYGRILGNYFDLSLRRAKLLALIQPLNAMVGTLSLALILLAGTFAFEVDGKIWAEMIVLYLVVMARLSGPVSTILRHRSALAQSEHATQLVVHFLEATEIPSMVDGTVSFAGLQKEVALENVHFHYIGTDAPALDSVSLVIPKGSTTAIVGASGGGKTTLLKLLNRFHDPDEGRVLIDGRDLRDFEIATWRRAVGVVSQNTFIFNDTIGNNIRFARPEATEAEVEEASRNASLHEFIVSLPEGYATQVGERGMRLSGGEAQRLAIARALLIDPPLLILDEATSSLDSVNERKVQESLDRLRCNRTVVIVAHRLATVRGADRIHVIEKGHVVESGAYDELMARRGAFWRYARLQFIKEGVDIPASGFMNEAVNAS